MNADFGSLTEQPPSIFRFGLHCLGRNGYGF